ncbi:MAG: VOC family protein [Thermoplasmata archaeon]|nr:VOC family protein [Thermoplasmata archaeon]
MATKRPDIGNYNWVEIVSKRPAATEKFFHAVFGWKFEKDAAMKGYTFYTTTAEPNGGLRTPMMKGEPAGTMPYIGVTSIDKTIVKIKASGGKILVPKTEIPPGWFAVFRAPGGVVQAVIEGR